MCKHVHFFFKQQTPYELRISDWSSDVCSSDLRFGMGCKAQAARSRGGKRRGDLFRGSLTSDCLFETNNASRSLRGTNSSVLGDTMKISIKQFAFMLCVSLASMQPAMSENISIATGGTEIGRASWRERVCQYV